MKLMSRRWVFPVALCVTVAEAMAANSVDFTSLVTNHSFESGFSGWTQSGMKLQNNQTFPLKDGDNYVERWVPADTQGGADACKVSQTISNVLPGKYELKVAAQNLLEGSDDAQTGVWVFAGENRTSVTKVADYVVEFDVLEASSGNIEIGYLADKASGNYLAVDNFRLTYTMTDHEAVKSFVGRICSDATAAVKDRKAGRNVINAFESSVAALQNAAAEGDPLAVVEAVSELMRIQEDVEVSAAVYAALGEAIAEAENAFQQIKGEEGADKVRQLIDEGKKMYDEAVADNSDVEAMSLSLMNAVLAFRISKSEGTAPDVETFPYVARGASFALGRAEVSGVEDKDLLETGFCWSTSPDAKVTDFRSTEYFDNNGIIYHMKGMRPSTVYYVRAYAMTKDYAVGYGDEVKIITIPKGTITWSYDPNGGSDDVNARITAAVEEAVEYWNNSTSISGYHVSCSYNAGVNTADCSYGGWVRVGPRVDYQRTGTLMHEMNHGVGVGQHSVWFGPSSKYRSGETTGDWLGVRATKLVRFLENDPSAMLHGDTQHMWPYGINGEHEDSGKEILYLANGLVTQAVGEDALPPVAGRIHTPSWFFENEEGVKYYLKTQSEKRAKFTNFVVESVSGDIEWTAMSTDDALKDDHAAWYISFDPVTCYYTFVNAASGNHMTWDSVAKTLKGVAPADVAEGHDLFQLTGSRKMYDVAGYCDYTYWITAAEKSSTPVTLTSTKAGMSLDAFNINSNLGNQHWHIFTADHMKDFDKAASVTGIDAEGAGSLFPADIYDVSGRLVRRNATDTEGLPRGIYIVGNMKIVVR